MTPTQRKAMEMALDALGTYRGLCIGWDDEEENAFQALRAALDEPEPSVTLHGYESLSATSDPLVYVEEPKPVSEEPVAWLYKWAHQDDGLPETDWEEGYEAARRVVRIHLESPPKREPGS